MNVYFFDTDHANISTIKDVSSKIDSIDFSTYINMKPRDFLLRIKNEENFIVFLDTRIKVRQKSCFDFAMTIRDINENCHIVFTSSFPEDVMFCMKNLIRPSGFLIKPIGTNEYISLIHNIHSRTHSSAKSGNKISITSLNKKYSILTNEILYFTTSGKKILCKLTSGKSIEFYSTLSKLEQDYSSLFLRCHHGFLVNKEYIHMYQKNFLTLQYSDEALPVSKKYHSSLKSFLEKVRLSQIMV